MQTLACLNGELMPADEARVPIWDRGFLFGDSIYEVWRLYEGRCWLDEAHLARLGRSLEQMWFPPVDLRRLQDRIGRTVEASRVAEGVVYVQVTRGVAPRKHTFPGPEVEPTELIVVRPYDDAETARLREVGVGVLSRPDWRWRRCDVKSTNLLANVLACEAAHRAGCPEAVLVDDRGTVTEATHSSLLWLRDGVLEGTADGPPILPGTSRHLVEELARSIGVRFRTAEIGLEELGGCPEVLLTGTTIEVMPVVRIDDRAVGGGVPGPVTRRLQEAFRRAVRDWLAAGGRGAPPVAAEAP